MVQRLLTASAAIGLTIAGCSPRAATKSGTPVVARRPTTQVSATELSALTEEIAGKIPWMDREFVVDRQPQGPFDAEAVAALWAQLRTRPGWFPDRFSNEQAAFNAGPWSADDIRPLLRHRDPKVRTLGIMLLFQLNRVDLLPEFADLIYDDAKTFSFPRQSSVMPADGSSSWRLEDQTVGEFAITAIKAYAWETPALGDIYLRLSGSGPPPFTVEELRSRLFSFASTRDPRLCTPALAVALRRATAGQDPMPDDRRDRVRALIGVAESLPMPRRFFVANRLDLYEFGVEQHSEDYILDMARQVPHDIRIAAVGGRHIDQDPDIADYATGYFEQHIPELFRAADADVFLNFERDERNRISADDPDHIADSCTKYAVMAARLRPADADLILADAWGRIHGELNNSTSAEARWDVAIAMAEIGGEPSLKQSLNWFFDFRPGATEIGPGRESWLAVLSARSPARTRILVEKIIRDPRLDRIGPRTTRMLIETVQGYLGRPLATEDEIAEAYHADESDPDTKAVPLNKWKQELRSTVDEWSK